MFKKKYLSSSIAMLVALGISQASAQDDSLPVTEDTDQMLEEVIVKGVRGSLMTAQNIKMNSQQIVDSIVAEDVGKLPDNSVAAALQRVTGVQITRMNGEASGVMVRGLPNVVTTLNGRNIFTTTGRGIALADIPADLLERVEVKKSAAADDIEGGIAGVIDVRLRRPFDFDDGFTIAGGLRAVRAENADSTDPIGSVTVNNNWRTDAGEFGAMLSVSYQDRGFMDQVNFNTAPFAVDITDPRSATPANPDEPTLIPNVIGQYFRYGDRNRTSANAAFQWAPSDSSQYYAELFHVGYEQDSQLNFWVPLPSWGGHVGYVSEYKPGTNVAKEFVRDNAPGTITSNQSFHNESSTTQFAIGGEWLFDDLTVTSDLAYTKSDADAQSFILDLVFFAPEVTYDFSQNGSGASDVQLRNADGTPYDLFNAENYELNQFFDQRGHQEGEEIAWQTDFNLQLGDGFVNSVDFGVRLSERDAFNQSADTGGQGNISGARVPLTDFPGLEDRTPDNFLSDVVELETQQWLTPNADYLLANRTEIREAMGYEPLPEGPPFLDAQYFDNTETNYSIYAKANYETEVGGMILDGQFGARVVQLESELNGTTTVDGEPQQESRDLSDTKVLPSASARLALTDELFLRAAASETITRPGFADLNPSTALFKPTPTQPFGSGSGGNPDLNSVEAVNYDLSLEWYYGPANSLTGGVFRRDIEGYIQFYSSEEVIDGLDYNITRPQNTGDGYVEGIELAVTHFFDELPGLWSGFGVQANATFMDGEADSPPDAEGNVRRESIANVSDESYNFILLYEKDKINARIAYNWRSDYYLSFDEAGDQPGNSVVVTDTDSLDAAVNYDFNDNLTFSVEATNLTDSVYNDYFGGGPQSDSVEQNLYPRDTFARERTYSVGVRFRY